MQRTATSRLDLGLFNVAATAIPLSLLSELSMRLTGPPGSEFYLQLTWPS